MKKESIGIGLVILLVIAVIVLSFLSNAGIFFIASCLVSTLTFSWLNAFAIWIVSIAVGVVVKIITFFIALFTA